VRPPEFGTCSRCEHQRDGPVAVCWACATRSLISGAAPRCGVCDHPLVAGRCANYWCGRADRGFDVVWAIALHAGHLRSVIARYKYRGGREFGPVLGRIVAGYLDEHSPWFEEFELLTPCPGRPTRERPWDHMGAVVDAAAELAGECWPFDAGPDRCVVKSWPTTPLMAAGPPVSRRLWAACDLRPALSVPDPARVRGRQILVLDDVFTDGSTLREVALVLRDAGAAGVSGLVLARQPWRC
jgi:predicted amidophosphoribosyltransferase